MNTQKKPGFGPGDLQKSHGQYATGGGGSQARLDAAQVKEFARGRWHEVLQALGIDPAFLVNKHGPCPFCGGTDRWRWDDRDGGGSGFCGQCGGYPDGFAVAAKHLGLDPHYDFPRVLETVAGVLGMTTGTAPSIHRLTHALPPRPAMDEVQANVRRRARERWSNIARANEQHPYLVTKGIAPPPELRQENDNLFVPMLATEDGRIVSAQFIKPDGTKRFMRGGRKQGCYFPIGDIDSAGPLAIVEGLATGCTVHQAMGWSVLVAFDAGNLLLVATWARSRWPERVIILAGDNDHADSKNPGKVKAEAAALAMGGKVALPPVELLPDGGSDWNDVAAAHDVDVVRQAIPEAMQTTPPPMEEQAAGDDVVQQHGTAGAMLTLMPPEEEQPAGVDVAALAAQPWNDIGNGQRFIARHGQDAQFVPSLGWHCWDGRRWQRDEGDLRILNLAQQTARAMVEEEPHLPPEADPEKFHRFCSQSGNGSRLREMLAQAAPHLALAVDRLDRDPWVLNVLNGTIDLKTGQLKSHDREAFITKLAPVAFDPDATCPTWMGFLKRIMGGSRELIEFLQRAIGYSLTGTTGEQCLFLLHGRGANGKSTLLETLAALLGDYARDTPFDSLLSKDGQGGGIPNDLARLQGSRLVSAVEPDVGKRFSESTIKQLTGGDRITARFLRQEFFEFRPEFKLWLAANHKPVIRGQDEGVWRRLRLIPFEVTIPQAERDAKLPERLRAELPGILAWAVRGCLEWQRIGLQPPSQVTAATTEYRSESDPLGDFIVACCVIDPGFSVKAADLYAVYQGWAGESGVDPVSQNLFGRLLTDRGYGKGQNRFGQAVRKGLALQATGVFTEDSTISRNFPSSSHTHAPTHAPTHTLPTGNRENSSKCSVTQKCSVTRMVEEVL